MASRGRSHIIAWLLAFAAASNVSAASRAAGLGHGTPPAAGGDPASFGVACSVGAPVWSPPVATAGDLPWRSVWFGHFSGGRPYASAAGRTLVEWRDDKLCFASRQNCQAWIASQRRAYHRPEGFWTCLLLR